LRTLIAIAVLVTSAFVPQATPTAQSCAGIDVAWIRGSTIRLSGNFEAASIDVGLSSVEGNDPKPTVNLGPRVKAYVGQGTHFANLFVHVHNVRGKTPTFRIDNRLNYIGIPRSTYRAVWSPDRSRWYYFHHTAVISGHLQFSNNTPFGHDSVYVALYPPYGVTELQADMKVWTASRYVHEPPSSRGKSFVLGRTLEEFNESGERISPQNLYSLEITDWNTLPADGSMKRVGVVICRVHPWEHGASYFLQGLIAFLLGPDPVAASLRRHFRILIYPMETPDGVTDGDWYGSSQAGVEQEDPNRHLHLNNMEGPRLHRLAVQQDIAGEPIAFFLDVHGWRRYKRGAYAGGTPEDAEFIKAIEAYSGPIHVFGVTNFLSNTHYFIHSLKVRHAHVVEIGMDAITDTGDVTRDLNDVRLYGEQHLRAVMDLLNRGRWPR